MEMELQLNNTTEVDNVIICEDLDSILDFINEANSELKRKIFDVIESTEKYSISFFKLNTEGGYLAVYKRGTIDNTVVYISDTRKQMSDYMEKHPIHSSANDEILKLLNTI